MTGGGIGFDYSVLREEGAIIKKTGGISTGPIALINMVNESGRYIMQGGQRRSAIWAGLRWSHPDCNKFLHLKDYSETLKAAKALDFNFLPTDTVGFIPVELSLADLAALEPYHGKSLHERSYLTGCQISPSMISSAALTTRLSNVTIIDELPFGAVLFGMKLRTTNHN